MKTKPAQYTQDRRMFLKGVIAAGGATALTAVAASRFGDSQDSGVHPADDPAAAPQGYRETEHIRAFYRTLRD